VAPQGLLESERGLLAGVMRLPGFPAAQVGLECAVVGVERDALDDFRLRIDDVEEFAVNHRLAVAVLIGEEGLGGEVDE
jgi:hypothetical protein